MTSRTLSKRLQRLETRMMPAGEPVVILVQIRLAGRDCEGRIPILRAGRRGGATRGRPRGEPEAQWLLAGSS
jgi:hypothetical protein